MNHYDTHPEYHDENEKAPTIVEALKCGRGGEIRTPNIRIWNPSFCRWNYTPADEANNT
jgi:hypothetical protein